MKLKLPCGNGVRVIAPSTSGLKLSKEIKELANKRLSSIGLEVTYGANFFEEDLFGVAPAKLRAKDFNDGIKDSKISIILSAIGGYNSNEILTLIDYEWIKKHPKIICGYSDMTAILNAIYAKTGLITFLGPHYSSFGEKNGFDFTLKNFQEILLVNNEIEIKPSRVWSDDSWYRDQENRNFEKNEGHWVINTGSAEGTIIGGNLFTFQNLAGTEYMPRLDKDVILFLEDDKLADKNQIRSHLVSLSLIQGFDKHVKGLVFGRFQKKSEISKEDIHHISKIIPLLNRIPIVANVDFGHTTPMYTIPIGGLVKIELKNNPKNSKIIMKY